MNAWRVRRQQHSRKYERKHLLGWLQSKWSLGRLDAADVGTKSSSSFDVDRLEYTSELEPNDSISKTLINGLESMAFLHRCAITTCNLVPLVPLTPLLWVSTSLPGITRVHSLYYRWSAQVIASWGPTAVKFLQWASTRNDLFPEQFCSILKQYQARVAPDPFPYQCLLYAAGLTRKNRAEGLIKAECMGSGSVAQVHYILSGQQCLDKKTNETTETETRTEEGLFHQNVCKILRPYVQKQVKRDLAWAWAGCRLMYLVPGEWKTWIPLSRSLQNFEQLILPQTNLKQEALNLMAFGDNFRTASSLRLLKRAGGSIRFPRVYYSTEEVLVEASEKGIPFDSWMRLKCTIDPPHRSLMLLRSITDHVTRRRTRLLHRPPVSLVSAERETRELGKRVARVGAHMFLQMLLYDNLVHTDLHPGNILLRFTPRQAETTAKGYFFQKVQDYAFKLLDFCHIPTPSRDCKLELVILDAGLTSSLQEKDRDNFIDLFRAIAFGDGYHAGHLMLTRARKHACEDADGFCRAVSQIVEKHVGPPISMWDLRLIANRNRFTMRNLHIGDVLHKILSCTLRFKVELDPSFVGIILATTILEGVGKGLDPDLDLLQVARPFFQTLLYHQAKPTSDT